MIKKIITKIIDVSFNLMMGIGLTGMWLGILESTINNPNIINLFLSIMLFIPFGLGGIGMILHCNIFGISEVGGGSLEKFQ